jgi:hypothetical protein
MAALRIKTISLHPLKIVVTVCLYPGQQDVRESDLSNGQIVSLMEKADPYFFYFAAYNVNMRDSYLRLCRHFQPLRLVSGATRLQII